MGYLKDIKDYPNQYEYAWKFWNRWYRPENTTIIVVGKVKPSDMLAMVKRYWSDWKPGDAKVTIPAEPAQTEARKAHIEWESPVPPHLIVAYRSPAYSDTEKDKAALDLFSSIAFGDNSDVYKKLVLEEQKADFVGPDFDNKVDPELFYVYSRIKKDEDLDYVKGKIIDVFKRYSTELIPQSKLDETRMRSRYGFAMALNSNDAIANGIAPYVALRRSPATIEKLFVLYDSITPEDIRSAVSRHFKDTNQTVVTLTAKGGTK
jgi:zinc protease